MGAFLLASISMFTSCKDYADDISSVRKDVTSLQDQIKTLQSDLASAKQTASDALANAATAQKAGDDARALAQAAQAAAAAAQAKADQNAINLANQLVLINGKVDQSVYNQKVNELAAAILAINTQLLDLSNADQALQNKDNAQDASLADLASADKALQNKDIAQDAVILDLQGQISTLNEFKSQIDALNLTQKFPELVSTVDQTVKALTDLQVTVAGHTSQLDALLTAVTANTSDLAALKEIVAKNTADLSDAKSAIVALTADLATLKDNLTALTSTVANNSSAIAALQTAFNKMTNDLTALQNAVATNSTDIAQLKNDMQLANDAINLLDQALNNKIADLAARVTTNETNIAANSVSINALNIFVSHTITSLVYNPSEWVLSFPAIPVYAIDSLHQITVTPATTPTVYGENYAVADDVFSINPQAVAKYWLNPSTADIKNYSFKFVDLETTDRYATRGHNDASAIDPKVDTVTTAGGILTVFFNFNTANVNDAVIDKATGKAWVSTLALQATNKNLLNEDATVTSDYAVLAPTYMKCLDLGNNEYKENVPPVRGIQDYFVVKTSKEAIDAFKAKSDSVAFKLSYKDEAGINLDEKVDVLFKESASADGALSALKSMTVAEAREKGMQVTYTLVPWTKTAGGADETAASKVQIVDGVATVNPVGTMEAIGHMAVVRVEVKSGNKTAVIGYISILVTPDGEFKVAETYSQGLYINCEKDSAKLVTSAQLFNDMMTETTLPLTTVQSYTLENARYTGMNVANVDTTPFGVVSLTSDQLVWEFTEAELRARFYDANGKFIAPTEDLVTYVRMMSPDATLYPNVWVKLVIGKDVIFHAQGKVDLASGVAGGGIQQSWYASGSTIAGSGYAEIHANVAQPNNAGVTDDKNFESNLLSTFIGNKALATITNAHFAGFTNQLSIQFNVAKYAAEMTNGKTWVGTSGTKYVLSATPDTVFAQAEGGGKTPIVILKDSAQMVNGNSIPGRWVVFQNNDPAKDLLNTYSHRDAANHDVTKAFYTYMIFADNENCFSLDLSGTTTFDVRYLRPIDVTSSQTAPFEDAALSGYSEVNIADLFNFNDWRDFSFGKGVHEDWLAFYGITALTPNLGETLTNITGTWKKLSDVTNLIQLTTLDITDPAVISHSWIEFVQNMGKIRYQNNGFTVGEFDIQIPFTVVHNWGKIENVMITVHVKKSVNNAKKF